MESSTNKPSSSLVAVSGLTLEVERRGHGAPLLLLYGEEALEREAPFLDELASRYELIIPSPPGFGHSERPDWIAAPDDIAYVYLDLIKQLGLNAVTLVGFSFGGWLAAEMATKTCSFIKQIVLVAPLGIKVGSATDVDIQDIWLLHPAKVEALKWRDPVKGQRDFPSMSDDELTIVARNSESFARFCWEPYMHNPKLKHRLHRIEAPTTLIWGENDGFVTPRYGEAYRALIPGATMTVIPDAGHLPHMEQPQVFMRHLMTVIG